MKKILVAMVAILMFVAPVAAHQPPPGNDGNYCHGANQIDCRPDPQPSHGQDCEAHGNNPDGNDDHCSVTTTSSSSSESTTESSTDETTTSETTTTESTSTESTATTTETTNTTTESTATTTTSEPSTSLPPAVQGTPSTTPPPTDTGQPAASTSNQSWIIIYALLVLIGAGLLSRLPRRG